MATVLSFIDKSGRPGSITFPNRTVAEVYARNVKAPKFTETDELVSVQVVECGTPWEEDAKRKRQAQAELAERQAEAAFEAGSQTVLAGGSASEALDNARDAARNAGNVCECGKPCGKFYTVCYVCRRYR